MSGGPSLGIHGAEFLDEFVQELHAEVRDPQGVTHDHLYPHTFMMTHTNHPDIAAFLAAGGNPGGAALDAYVRSTTDFESYRALEAAAQRAYIARRILDWII